ncbi:hypothetical protein T484DRAFT_1792731 [Baffinella frigidus]|nr:hypothetical protein T484DRAFT_1792731 [Cryptophyta sp. CCMP2293]
MSFNKIDVGEMVGCDVAGEMVRAAKDKRLYSSVAQQMVRAAKDKRLYSSVAQQGAAEFLSAEAPGSVNVVIAGNGAAEFLSAEAPGSVNVVIAGDVAPWVGVLAPLFTAAKKALAPGGLMVGVLAPGGLMVR